MKVIRSYFSPFFLALALTALLPLAAPPAAAQNANSSTTAEPTMTRQAAPSGQCKRKCANSYRKCLVRAGRNRRERRSCRPRYELCLGYC